MFVVGLTGSIGMGKSTAASMIKSLGFPVFDADESVKALLKQPNIIQQIRKKFPSSVRDGRIIDKEELRSIVFMNHERLDVLEQILHPVVKKDRQTFIDQKKLEGHKIAFLDIPLLFEIKSDSEVDATLVVSAPKFIQKRRVLKRAGFSREYWSFLQERQIPDSTKRKKADYVIHSFCGVFFLKHQIKNVIKNIKKRYLK